MKKERAHARRGDPKTSHMAAEAATYALSPTQREVEAYARKRGKEGFCDKQMYIDLQVGGANHRSRRKELTIRNILINSGRKVLCGETRNWRIVWVHRDFVENPPPVKATHKIDYSTARNLGRKIAVQIWGKDDADIIFSEVHDNAPDTRRIKAINAAKAVIRAIQ